MKATHTWKGKNVCCECGLHRSFTWSAVYNQNRTLYLVKNQWTFARPECKLTLNGMIALYVAQELHNV